ncbi:helix-turn-helix transcriptional regulator [Paenibacillus oryzisoli]|uniref:HTH deoR-type domain-containing protein n=1 Tax=Paenibacillus oryzisoli TaxID=1850517 RepID=A0A198A223_9BACL|nr:YafY family protein [Paenibacillus oryzisoli]OAS15058.1 hypothetical protein A8708_22250 [Paenibacillus oryzisoli]
MRADRLLQIMMMLQTRGGMTTRALAARLEVSERTIHRDMEALSTAGVPVYAERGAAGGWRLMEGYQADWAGLHKDELLALLAAEPHRHLTDLGFGDAYEAAVLKVLASLSPTLRRDAEYMRQRVYVDAAGWHQTIEELPWLSLLQEAVWEDRKLWILYASSGDSGASERMVNPLGLVLKGSLWYLIAASGLEEEPRTYRVSRIQDAALLDEPVIRPDHFNLAAYWQRSVDLFRSGLPHYAAQTLVHPSVATRLEQTRFVRVTAWHEAHEDESSSANANDPIVWRKAELAFNTLSSACEILLGFGTMVRVLEPLALREALLEAANNIAFMYSGK